MTATNDPTTAAPKLPAEVLAAVQVLLQYAASTTKPAEQPKPQAEPAQVVDAKPAEAAPIPKVVEVAARPLTQMEQDKKYLAMRRALKLIGAYMADPSAGMNERMSVAQAILSIQDDIPVDSPIRQSGIEFKENALFNALGDDQNSNFNKAFSAWAYAQIKSQMAGGLYLRDNMIFANEIVRVTNDMTKKSYNPQYAADILAIFADILGAEFTWPGTTKPDAAYFASKLALANDSVFAQNIKDGLAKYFELNLRRVQDASKKLGFEIVPDSPDKITYENPADIFLNRKLQVLFNEREERKKGKDKAQKAQIDKDYAQPEIQLRETADGINETLKTAFGKAYSGLKITAVAKDDTRERILPLELLPPRSNLYKSAPDGSTALKTDADAEYDMAREKTFGKIRDLATKLVATANTPKDSGPAKPSSEAGVGGKLFVLAGMAALQRP